MNENIQPINKINKPALLLREEFVINMSNLINNSGLPLFVIEPILRDLLNDVNIELKKQYEHEKMRYESALKALQESENVEGEQYDRKTVSKETK